MKAKARKILALIMAMVMCLSLAAPAFAGSYNATDGTWTYSATEDKDLFSDAYASADSGATALPSVITTEAEYFTATSSETNLTDGDRYYKVGNKYYTESGSEVTAELPLSDLNGVTAWAAVPVYVKAKQSVITEIKVSGSDYIAKGFKATNPYLLTDGKALASADDVKGEACEYIGDSIIATFAQTAINHGSGTEANEDGSECTVVSFFAKGEDYKPDRGGVVTATTTWDSKYDGKFTYKPVGSSPAVAYSIAGSTDGSGNFTVYTIEKDGVYTVATGKVGGVDAGKITANAKFAAKATDKDLADTIKVEKTEGKDLIGVDMTQTSYKVLFSDTKAFTGNSYVVAPVTMGDNSGKRKSFSDLKDSDWTALPDGQTFTAGGETYQVKGSVYQEPQGDNNLVKAYFKLELVDERDNWTGTTVYYVNTTAQATISAAGMGAVLADAVMCTDDYGTAGTVAITNTDAAGKTKVAVKSKTLPQDDVVVYGYTAMNPSDGLEVSGTAADLTGKTNGTFSVEFTSGTEATTGTFKMSVKSATFKTGVADPTEAYVTDAAQAQEILKKNWSSSTATLESVEAVSGTNYFTVTVSKIATADPYDYSTAKYGKNVWYYGTKLEPVLVDQGTAGWYNATTAQGANAKQIPAGTVALGPVVVRASDVPSGVTIEDKTITGGAPATVSGYYIFEKVADVKLTTTDCKSAKNIPYTQVVLNPYNGTKQNKLVNTVEKSATVDKGALTPSNASDAVKKNVITDVLAQDVAYKVELTNTFYSDAFNTPNADFVQKGTLELDAASHKNKIELVEKVDATCEKPGTKTVKVKCTDCNQIISETTTEIPVVTDPVEVNTKDKTTDANGDQVNLVAFDETATATHSTTHFVKKAETVTTTSEDKTTTIVTTTYTCNFGVVHPELTRTVTLKKTSLQNSGRWNHFSMTGRDEKVIASSQDAVSNLFGYTEGIVIADSDVELEGLPLNRKAENIPADNRTTLDRNNGGDLTIKFAANALARAAKNDDGSYTTYSGDVTLNNVYATATGTPVTKHYVAKLTAKVTKDPVYVCHTGAGNVTVEVYEVDTAKATITNNDINTAIGEANLEKNVSKGYVKLLKTYSQDVEIRAGSYHDYDEVSGICKICLEGREAVESAKFDASTVTVGNLVYTGKAKNPKVTVYDTQGNKLIKDIDYKVESIEDVNVGEYTITVKGIDDYAGNRVTMPFSITKAAQPMTVKATAPSAKKLKKKAQKVALTIKKAQGKVSVKVSGPATVKGTTVTAKKGTKKGKKIKITVTAAGNANYKKGSKTVTVKVKA